MRPVRSDGMLESDANKEVGTMFGMGLPPIWHAATHTSWTGGPVDWVVVAVIAAMLVAYEVCAFLLVRKMNRETPGSIEPAASELPKVELPVAA